MSKALGPSATSVRPPRRTSRALPVQPYVPGEGPHPRNITMSAQPYRPFDVGLGWAHDERLIHGIELIEQGYFWWAHEVMEHRWKALSRGTPYRDHCQSLIQVAAALLLGHMGRDTAAMRLIQRSHRRMSVIPDAMQRPVYGVDWPVVLAHTTEVVEGRRAHLGAILEPHVRIYGAEG